MAIQEERDYRVKMARAVATQMSKKHGLSVPVDVIGFCTTVGLEIYYDDEMEGEFSAILRRDLKAIAVNTTHALVRQRFSVAHELGHWYLHSDDALSREYTVSMHVINDLLDQEANAFAAEFLIPSRILRAMVRRGVWNLKDLTDQCQVSPEAMWHQLNHLRLAHRVSA